MIMIKEHSLKVRRLALGLFVAAIVALFAGLAEAREDLPAPAGGSAQEPRPWLEKVAPSVLTQAANATRELDVLVELRVSSEVSPESTGVESARERVLRLAATADALASEWSPGGVRLLDRYSHVPVLHLSVPPLVLPALAEDPRIEAVVPNRSVRAFDTVGNAYIHVNAVQPPNTGKGVGIAILDTGVDFTHPELAPLGTKTIALFDAYRTAGDSLYGADDNGHGTEVAGIAAAAGQNAAAIGVAPAATVISVKVLDSKGNGTENKIVAGINAVLSSVAAGNPYNIRVANLSLGGYFTDQGSGAAAVPAQPCDGDDKVIADLFAQLMSANVVPVVASGNGGCTVGVAWPACISSSLAVGSVYDQSFQYASYSDSLQCNASGVTGCRDDLPTPGTVACFTDSGPKLDVWAPTGAVTPTKGGGYDTQGFFGTSASTPFVSGLVADLAQLAPGSTAAALRLAIRDHGLPLTDGRNSMTRNLVHAGLAAAAISCTPPPAPAGFAASKTSVCGGEAAVLSWSSAAGASSYTVQTSTDSAFSLPTSVTTNAQSYSFTTTRSEAGSFYFRVAANGSCGSSPWSSTVQLSYAPQCTSGSAQTYFLSGIARTPGIAPAYWYTDVTVLNTTATTANVQISFHGVHSSPAPRTFTLASGVQLTWTDVLGTLFGLEQDKGMIVLDSSVPVELLARTYSQVTSGGVTSTFGQSYVGEQASQALTSSTLGYLPGLRSGGSFRTNIELANLSGVATDVQVTLYSSGGAILRTLTQTVPALAWVQIGQALPAGVTGAYAKLQVLAAGAQIIGFASVIDGVSTDPTTVPLWVVSP